MDSDFEKFLGGPSGKKSERLYVSINNTGRIGLNREMYRLLGSPPAACLYYSRDRETIIVEPVKSSLLPTSFPILQNYTMGWRINAASFCTHFNIHPDSTKRFIHPEINPEGHLVLKLPETVTVRQLRRKKR